MLEVVGRQRRLPVQHMYNDTFLNAIRFFFLILQGLNRYSIMTTNLKIECELSVK